MQQQSIVVGIDGSRTAVDAALWAVDEAVSRDIPLRLLYAIDPDDVEAVDAARALATAEIAVRYAFTAIEATEQPVKIEVEIVQQKPIRALATAAKSAVLICVGAVGLKNATHGRIGSTAAALARSAPCPVAIIRRRTVSMSNGAGCVLVEVDEWPTSSAVLERGVDEARLRHTPLCVLTNRLTEPQLDRRLAGWRRRYPDLDVRAVTNHGRTLDYLARHKNAVQLVVVGAERSGGTNELVGPAGLAVLQNTDCSVLACDRQQRL